MVVERTHDGIDRRNALALVGGLPFATLASSAQALGLDASPADVARAREALDAGWKFHLGDANELDRDFGFGANQRTYAKQGFAVASAASADFTDIQWGKTNFDDSGWADVILPHDWAAALPFTPNARFHPTSPDSEDPRNGHGFKPLGREYPATSIGWYRRRFQLSDQDAGRRLSLEFDGVFRDALIIVNGYILARNESGYAPFRVDITDIANLAGDNLITVRVDATLGEGWFYEGAGLYRRVWLVKTAPLHLPQWGVAIRSRADGTVDALIAVRLEADDAPGDAVIVTTVLDPTGTMVASARSRPASPAPWTDLVVPQSLKVPKPQRWDIASPALYTLSVAIELGGRIVDRVDHRFGLRDLAFDPERGFFLNGRAIKLRGANLHQDHAGVGTAITAPLNRFRLERMIEMGCNAIRTSHAAASSEFMDLCDELGLLVIAENRWMSSSPEAIGQLERLVLRDRNRPSVIAWSLGNEEPHEASVRGARIVHSQMRVVRALDPTRLIGAAFDNSFTKPTGIAPELDFIGVNYNADELVRIHAAFPRKIVIATEVGSSVATRGIYRRDDAARHLPAYDTEKPPWGQLAHSWLPDIESKPYVAGGFVWTGLDYHGEPTPFYTWPSVASQFGLYDSCGFPKDTAFYVRAWWRPDEPLLHLFPHWNWSSREGETIDVWCHSNLDAVELWLNGKSLGRKPVARYGYVVWQVPYAAGRLEARAFRNGSAVAHEVRETTGAPTSLRLTAERNRLAADGQDVALVTVSAMDARGRTVPTANTRISFEVSNLLWVAGTGNGDPSSHEPEQESSVRLFNGLCQIILRTRPGRSGPARLLVTAAGLISASLDFAVA